MPVLQESSLHNSAPSAFLRYIFFGMFSQNICLAKVKK